MKIYLFVVSVVGLLLFAFVVRAGGIKSDRIKPRWMSELPQSGTSAWYFKVVFSDAASNLEEARVLARKELANSVEKSERILVDETLDYHSVESGKTGKDETTVQYSFKVKSSGAPVYIQYERIDEYSEVIYQHGRRVLRLYTLFSVGRKNETLDVGTVTLSSQYGARGLVRSIVPGWGQMYKGSTAKGVCILGGEVAFAAAIIAAESLRASYVKKMKENPKLLKTYNTKADNWENVRNICIGGATALYVYNLIDAIVAPGARRIVVKPSKNLAVLPVVTPDYSGISLVFNL